MAICLLAQTRYICRWQMRYANARYDIDSFSRRSVYWERWERCQRQMKRPERVAAVGERGSRSVGNEGTGHRNRSAQHISLPQAISQIPPGIYIAGRSVIALLHPTRKPRSGVMGAKAAPLSAGLEGVRDFNRPAWPGGWLPAPLPPSPRQPPWAGRRIWRQAWGAAGRRSPGSGIF